MCSYGYTSFRFQLGILKWDNQNEQFLSDNMTAFKKFGHILINSTSVLWSFYSI